VKPELSAELLEGAQCDVIAGTHAGKSGTVTDIKTSPTGHISITVVQANGVKLKTLAKNVALCPRATECRGGLRPDGIGGGSLNFWRIAQVFLVVGMLFSSESFAADATVGALLNIEIESRSATDIGSGNGIAVDSSVLVAFYKTVTLQIDQYRVVLMTSDKAVSTDGPAGLGVQVALSDTRSDPAVLIGHGSVVVPLGDSRALEMTSPNGTKYVVTVQGSLATVPPSKP
jgi:hypothetical protein